MDTAKKVIRNYKFRIYPNKTQVEKLEFTLDLCRELYNSALQERRDAWTLQRQTISFYDQKNQLPEIKNIRTELTCIYSTVLCDVLSRVDKAFKGFFKRVKENKKSGYPRFKNVNRYNSISYLTSGFSINGKRLHLSKIGEIKLKLSRMVSGKIKNCLIKKEAGKWFAILNVETICHPIQETKESIGIDVGLLAFATLSNGNKIENPRFYECSQKKLALLQKKLSRSVKGSKNAEKKKLKVQKINYKIKNQRVDFLHKISTDLIKRFGVICVEKLNITGLTKGHFPKQILDASWNGFIQKLKYKAENAGRTVVEVNPRFTSQDCSDCGFRQKKDLSERVHICEKCGLILDRDENAARNILRLGLSLLTVT